MTKSPRKDTHRKPRDGTKSALSDEERHKRFIALAKEVGADETPESFDRAFRRVVGAPAQRKPDER